MNIKLFLLFVPSLLLSLNGQVVNTKWLLLLLALSSLVIFIKSKKISISRFDILLFVTTSAVILYNTILLDSPLLNSIHIYLCLYLFVKILMSNEKLELINVLKLLIASSIFLISLDFINLLFGIGGTGGGRIYGLYYNANHFSLVLVFSFLASLVVYNLESSKLSYITLLIISAWLGLLESRTYFLIAIVLLVYFSLQNRKNLYKYILIFCVLFMSGFIASKVSTNVQYKLNSRVLDKITKLEKEGRFTVWKNSWQMFKEQKKGYGLGSFAFRYNYNNAPQDSFDQLRIFKTPHNEFVRIIFELGFLGILLIFLLIASMYLYLKMYRALLLPVKQWYIDGFIIISGFIFCLQFPLNRSFFYFLSVISLSLLKFKPIFRINKYYIGIPATLLSAYLIIGVLGRVTSFPQPYNQFYCKYWTSEVQGCLSQVRAMKPESALEAVTYSMPYHKYDFHYWQALGLLEYQNGEQLEGCKSLNIYNQLTYNKYPQMVSFYQFKCDHYNLGKESIHSVFNQKSFVKNNK